MKSLQPDWKTILSAVLVVLSFPTWNFSFLIWIALVPWFLALYEKKNYKAAIVQGIWLSLLMSLGGFYWVAYVLHEFAKVPWPLAIFFLICFSLFNQIQFVLLAPVQRLLQLSAIRTQNRYSIAILTLSSAFLYAGADQLLPKLFLDTLGHALHNSPSLRQVADLGGAGLLTFVIFCVNMSITLLFLSFRHRTEPSIWPTLKLNSAHLLLTILIACSALMYGVKRLESIEAWMAEPKQRLQMGIIQANIGDFDKVAAEQGVRGAANKILQTLFSMSEKALALSPKPEVLVWPETSYPSTFRTPQTSDELLRDQQVESFVRTTGTPLLFGGYDHYNGKDFNAFFFLSPHYGMPGDDLKIYRKSKLLMFGEYIPGAESIQFIREAFPQVGYFGHGAGPEAIELPSKDRSKKIKTGPIICYEALFPSFLIEEARKGAQFILNITNDSWFGPYGEPHLHLALTTFRSIETRLPQVRSTNTGVSALILPDGSITQQTAVFQPEIMNISVPIYEQKSTLMLLWGDWFGVASILLAFAGLSGYFALPAVLALSERKKKKPITT